MRTIPRRRLSMPAISTVPAIGAIAVVIVLMGGLALLDPAPANAQCLSQSECSALKTQMRELKQDAREIKQQLRDLKIEIRSLPSDSERRASLKKQARELRRKIRELRKEEVRPLRQQFRAGCRNC